MAASSRSFFAAAATFSLKRDGLPVSDGGIFSDRSNDGVLILGGSNHADEKAIADSEIRNTFIFNSSTLCQECGNAADLLSILLRLCSRKQPSFMHAHCCTCSSDMHVVTKQRRENSSGKKSGGARAPKAPNWREKRANLGADLKQFFFTGETPDQQKNVSKSMNIDQEEQNRTEKDKARRKSTKKHRSLINLKENDCDYCY